ncbi:MAG: hypothetical protein HY868_16170 [Chloroflexi bacterium]|nr:hypothetical protein [Chloroflexota bacterium]
MNAQEYYRQLLVLIGPVSAIVSSDVSYREIDENECYIKAVLKFVQGHVLHLAEYVVIVNDQVVRTKYRYQLLDAGNKSIARWDNAPHHKDVATFPHHRHDSMDKAHPSREMSPADAIAESLALIEPPL